MKIIRDLLFVALLLIFTSLNAQTEVNNEPAGEGNMIFSAAEEQYIAQWFQDFVEEMNLSEETAAVYEQITATYSSQIEALGNKEPPLTKSQLIEQFNDLMQRQHDEIKEILTEEQYEIYHDTMYKLVWSINKRLDQL